MGPGMRFVPVLIPVGFIGPVFAAGRLVPSTRAGTAVIFRVGFFLSPLVFFDSRHMGAQGGGVGSPRL